MIHLYLKYLKYIKKESLFIAKTDLNAVKDIYKEAAAAKLHAIDGDFLFLIPFF